MKKPQVERSGTLDLNVFEVRRRFWEGSLDPDGPGGCWSFYEEKHPICSNPLACPDSDWCLEDREMVRRRNAEAMKVAKPAFETEQPEEEAVQEAFGKKRRRRSRKETEIPRVFMPFQQAILKMPGIVPKPQVTGMGFAYLKKSVCKIVYPVSSQSLTVVLYNVKIRDIWTPEMENYIFLIDPKKKSNYRGKPMLVVTEKNWKMCFKTIKRAYNIVVEKCKIYGVSKGDMR